MSLEKDPLNTHILVWFDWVCVDFGFFAPKTKNKQNKPTDQKNPPKTHKTKNNPKKPTNKKNLSDEKTWNAKFCKKNFFTTNLRI